MASSSRSGLAVHRIADRHAPTFRKTFVASIHKMRAAATDSMIDRAIASRGVGQLGGLFDQIQFVKAAEPVELVTDTFAQIVSAVAQSLAPKSLIENLTITSPSVINRARNLAGTLVTNVTDESRKAIKTAITLSVRGKLDREETRWIIRQVIGLNNRQGTAVTNYATGLYQSDNPNADKLVADYSDRLLVSRADTIARTETMTAANYGQVDAWGAMQDAGYLPPDFQMEWLVTDDDRLCDDCAPMDGQQVGVGSQFEQTEKGVLPSDREPYNGPEVDAPPLHENCRCTLVAGDDGLS